MYYLLLKVKADDKAYHSITSYDSLMIDLVDYYKLGGDKQKLAEACYYAGRVFSDKHNGPQALDYFQQGENAIEESDHARIIKPVLYSQMGYLFNSQGVWKDAITYFHKSYQCAEQYKDTLSMIYALRDIGNTYKKEEAFDKSEICFRHALRYAEEIKDTIMINGVRSQLASLFLKEKRYDHAKEMLMPTLQNIYEPDKSSIYSIASKIYNSTGQLDSADYYSQWLISHGSLDAKAASNKMLVELYLKRGEATKALRHIQEYLKYDDSIVSFRNAEALIRANASFNYQKQLKENSDLKIQQTHAKVTIIVLIALLLLLLSFLGVYYFYARRKKIIMKVKQERLQRAQERILMLSEQRLEESRVEIETLKKEIDRLSQFNTDSDKVQLLIQKKNLLVIKSQKAEMEMREQRQNQMIVEESGIYRKIISLLNNPNITNKVLSEDDFAELSELIERVYPSFTETLFDYSKLSTHEYHVCLLLKIEMNPKQISELTAHSPQSISSTRSRLFQKFFGTKGSPSDWDKYIQYLCT